MADMYLIRGARATYFSSQRENLEETDCGATAKGV